MDNNDRSGRIEDKVDKLLDRVSSIDTTLAAQHVALTEHIRRTELLEKDMEPVKRHVSMVQGAMKFIGLIAVFSAIGEGIAIILEYFRPHK